MGGWGGGKRREYCHCDLLFRLCLGSMFHTIFQKFCTKLNLKLAQIRIHFEPMEWLLFIHFSYTEVRIVTNEHCYNRRTSFPFLVLRLDISFPMIANRAFDGMYAFKYTEESAPLKQFTFDPFFPSKFDQIVTNEIK